MSLTASVKIPDRLVPIFSGPARYRCAYGGRGSAKSYSFALMALVRGYAEPLRILCCREFQNSIRESMHSQFRQVIGDYPFLEDFYTVNETSIKGANGTEILYKGLHRNISAIKSMSDINICIVEEAEPVSAKSWEDLIPTIRAPNSEIWVIWNPRSDDAPVQSMFIEKRPRNCRIAEINYTDNPWFPAVLEEERLNCLHNTPERYDHIWLGKCETRSDAQVFADKYTVLEFEAQPHWTPYYGADWGFANDPTTAIRCFFEGSGIYIDYESWAYRISIDDIADKWRRDVPDIDRYPVSADNARPELITHVGRHGIRGLRSCRKYAGSVQEGVLFLQSKHIYVHPRCTNLLAELRRYSYKVDQRTGDILPDLIDADNHGIDALRYALQEFIRPRQPVARKANIVRV